MTSVRERRFLSRPQLAWRRMGRSDPHETARRPPLVPSLFIGAMIFAALYQAYRYPLQINDSLSPTYRDTPLFLQVAKYAVLGVVSAVLLFRARLESVRRLRAPELALIAFSAFVSTRMLISVVQSDDFAAVDIVAPIVVAVPIAVVTGMWLWDSGWASRLTKIVFGLAAAIVLAHAVANVVEIALWQLTGRLPALAYREQTQRFGGLWDDPNSCAAFSAAFAVALVGSRPRPSARWIAALAGAALFNLAVAWSYSAWLTLAAGLAVLALLRVRRKGLVVVGSVAAAAVAVFVIKNPSIVYDVPFAGEQIQAKADSARLRLDPSTHFAAPQDAGTWVMGSPYLPQQFENVFGDLLAVGGLAAVLLFCFWVILALFAARSNPALDGVFAAAVAIVVGSIFVPFPTTFPLGAFFVGALSLASMSAVRPARADSRLAAVVLPLTLLACAATVAVAVAIGANRPTGINLLWNPGAEFGLSGWEGWTPGRLLKVERTREATRVTDGDWAFRVRGRNGAKASNGVYVWTARSQNLEVRRGEAYFISASITGSASTKSPITLGIRTPDGRVTRTGMIPTGPGFVTRAAAARPRRLEALYFPRAEARINVVVWQANVQRNERFDLTIDDVVFRLEKTYTPHSAEPR